MSRVGMDVASMHHIADELERAAKEVNGIVFRVNAHIDRGIFEWFGEMAFEYANSWRLRSKAQLLIVEVQLLMLARTLRAQISEQEHASAADVSLPGGPRLREHQSATYDHGALRITAGPTYTGRGPRNVSDLLSPLRNDDKFGHSADPCSVYHYPGGIAVSVTGEVPDRHVIVTISGTRDLGVGGTDIDDMTTNVENAAGAYTAKEHAIAEAMLRAGVGPQDKIMLVGHSMGGADAIAFSHNHLHDKRFHVVSLVTVDAPQTPTDPSSSISTLAIEGNRDGVLYAGIDIDGPGDGVSVARVPEHLLSSPFTNHDPGFIQSRIPADSTAVANFQQRNADFFGGDATTTSMYSNERVAGNPVAYVESHQVQLIQRGLREIGGAVKGAL